MDNTNFITLHDGRKLAFSEYGKSDGTPIVYFHGFPGSRLEAEKFTEIALTNNYRIIAFDRPGFGLSTINKKRSLVSTIDDIVEAVNQLNIKKFAVVGHSGGGPYVAACAYTIGDRLTGAAIISGMSPFDNKNTHIGIVREQLMASKLVRIFPPLAKLMMKITKVMLNKSDTMLEKMIAPLPEVDQAIFRDPISCQKLISSTLEAFRCGENGAALEMKILLNNWGFKLEDINFPISIWHGSLDTQVPLSNGRLYAQLIPNAKLYIFENDGHHSIMKNQFQHILCTL